MGKREELDWLVHDGGGYLLTCEVVSHGISKPTLAAYVKRFEMIKAAHGVYCTKDTTPDPFYILYLRNKKIYFSHATSLWLLGMEKEQPPRMEVTVREGYNASHLRSRDVHVYQVKKEHYEVGASKGVTPQGHPVRLYDLERTLCDVVRDWRNTDSQRTEQLFQKYLESPKANVPRLMAYAGQLGILEKVRAFVDR